MVGSVVVDTEGRVLGEGWHQRYGGPHAEVHALSEAEERHGAEALRKATLYVNLEPCSHHGKTPPCADLILRKGVPRVVVGMVDPFPKVAGGGIRRLREAGVDVTVGVLKKACWRLNEAFVRHVQTGRPLVTLKLAQTLDGFIATPEGDSQWVTGTEARTLVHQWRAEQDAVLVGHGTARADDPSLTVRHVEGPHPRRLVLDREGTLPPTLRLFTDEQAHLTTAVVAEDIAPLYAEALREAGSHVLHVPQHDDHLDLGALLDRLGRPEDEAMPVQSLLVEAGPGLATALMAQDLVDRLSVFVAPKLLGAGLPALRLPPAARMAEARTFADARWHAVGNDALLQAFLRPATPSDR